MKRNRCNECQQEIDRHDFFMETKKGKICSDCLVESGPVEPDTAHLFTAQQTRHDKQDGSGVLLTLPLKEAL
ncbi:MAG: hypothetical protein CL942_14545 [Desulfovibrio sp.]|nr:hypothetical protein [Desulfovibrio sp.]MBC18257.1 hypothetical protein [Desulfovibrio sp.]